MHINKLVAAGAFAATTMLVQSPAPADSGTAPGLALTTTAERDCFEVLIQRPVTTASVDAIVPDRFGLPSTPTMTLFIHTYTCREVVLDEHVQVGHDKTTTVTIGSVNVTSIDGQPTSGFNGYVLWYGTDNPVLFARLQQTGMPATFLPHTVSSIPEAPQTGAPVAVDWAIRGDGIDYDLHADAVEPATHPDASVVRFLYDVPNGNHVRITVQNEQSGQIPSTSTTGQLAGIDILQGLLTDPRFNTIPQPGAVAHLAYNRGSWSSQITID